MQSATQTTAIPSPLPSTLLAQYPPMVQPTTKPDRAQWITELNGFPADFIPLEFEKRTHVTTAVMCRHLGRKAQTARCWAMNEDGPLIPIRVHGRLAWAVADIRHLLGVA
jgi:hypothetical protein